MIGVNFQPGAGGDGPGTRPNNGGNTNAGVQEAIKVLSLRLPKVVGAQGISPQALLSSQGSGGNSRVDSIVNSVLSRMFPSGAEGQQAQASMPSFGTAPASQPAPYQMPNFSGSHSGPQVQTTAYDAPSRNPWSTMPRVIAGGGPGMLPVGDFMTGAGGSPYPGFTGGGGNPWGVYEDLPTGFTPPAPRPATPSFDTAPPEEYGPPSI